MTVGLHANGGIVLTVEDNGVGMRRNDGPDEESGHGLALHSTLMAVIGGVMTVDSAPDSYTCVTLSLPAGIVG